MKLQVRGSTLWICAAVAVASLNAPAVLGQVFIGNWETGTREGWIDWNTGSPTATVEPPKFEFNSIGATHGSGAIQYNSPGGYTQWLAIKLQLDTGDPLSNGLDEWKDDFMENTKFSFDMTLVADEQTQGNDFANLGIFVNANGWGFTRIGDPATNNAPESVTPFTGYNGENSFNPSLLVGTQTTTWTYDIGFLHDGNMENGEIPDPPQYIEIIFEMFSNAATVLHIDNVQLFTPVTQLEGDYNSNGVVDAADYAVWRDHDGETFALPNEGAGQSPGVVDQADYEFWMARFGSTGGSGGSLSAAVPEPASLLASLLGACGFLATRRRQCSRIVRANSPT